MVALVVVAQHRDPHTRRVSASNLDIPASLSVLMDRKV
jgi:hypothetical protein